MTWQWVALIGLFLLWSVAVMALSAGKALRDRELQSLEERADRLEEIVKTLRK